MVSINPTTLFLAAIAIGNVNAWTWTHCTNAERCVAGSNPNASGGTTGGNKNMPSTGSRFSYAGGYVFVADSCTNFSYQGSDGYWYSHEKDGLFVSPAGYMRTAHDCNLLVIDSKSQTTGITWWWKHNGGDCCLPDEVGTNIFNIEAYYTGAQ
ncbi:uncharacterized protein ColSpa_01346 [Colletotrichum spaethianum]|uniref:Uncharacterized protein n=1 Tax=Colletotrichum spaethianum TaxID=700344 RepID=A0AA37NWB6_9PEZI|nr:uncharacterized protein ColSpa_01346 [Colletotrichum spaethianum]GKT41165.1 hypothetical protein ColSpa_01346 [Colletotrichum spaethianum]